MKKQCGLSLITAIFLLVLLAGLGAAIVSVTTTSQTRSALDVMSARAYQAARSGVEWGLYQITINSSCVATSNLTFPATATTLGPGSPSPFVVTVTCLRTIDANNGPDVHTVTATSCNKPNGGACPGTPGLNYVERRLSVTF